MTDRQAQYRESKAKARKAKRTAGLAPLEVWAKPSDHAAPAPLPPPPETTP